MSEFPRKESRSSGGSFGYSVEARLAEYADPQEIAGQLITNKWKRIDFAHVPNGLGVPDGPAYARELREWSLVSYPAAQALRWWIHASMEAASFTTGLSLETRIIKHELKYSSSCCAISEHGFIQGEDRSNCIPDWGTPPASVDRNPKGEDPEEGLRAKHESAVPPQAADAQPVSKDHP